MESAPSPTRPLRNLRSAFSWIPALSLLCLVLSRTALHHTRYEDGVLGFGVGTLLAFVLADLIARIVPGAFEPRQPEDSDLQTLSLGR